MDEIIEGEVGRSVKWEGKEYWMREPDPIQDISEFKEKFFKEDSYKYRHLIYQYPYIKDPKFLFNRIVQA
jgi:hypothetical protein